MADSGARLAFGELFLPVIPAGNTKEFAWTSQLPDLTKLAAAAVNSTAAAAPLCSWYLELRTTVTTPTSWCDAGHQVALTQIPLPLPAGGFVLPLTVPAGPSVFESAPLRVLDAGDNLLQVQCAGGVHMVGLYKFNSVYP